MLVQEGHLDKRKRAVLELNQLRLTKTLSTLTEGKVYSYLKKPTNGEPTTNTLSLFTRYVWLILLKAFGKSMYITSTYLMRSEVVLQSTYW